MVHGRKENDRLIISLAGEINSFNAPQVEDQINEIREEYPCSLIELDCDELKYVTSAGLRVMLRLIQQVDDVRIANVHSELYEILEMTGFTEMTDVRKAYRVFSVEGCEVIGQGANGKVYRIDPDTIVKVYLNPDALPEIHRERELARLAFVAGVPTAIPYDVVRIGGGGYGSVFELLNAKSFAKLLMDNDQPLDQVAKMSIDLLKLIHSKVVRLDSLPDMKAVALDWTDFLKDYLPAEQYEKLHALIADVPQDDHLMHGDYHIKNIEYQNGEYLLIDMDTLCHGDPIFELANMFAAYVGFGENCPGETMEFFGLPEDVCENFWKKSLTRYLGYSLEQEKDPGVQKVVLDTENKVKVVGYTRLIKWMVSHRIDKTEADRKRMEQYKAELMEALDSVEDLRLPV